MPLQPLHGARDPQRKVVPLGWTCVLAQHQGQSRPRTQVGPPRPSHHEHFLHQPTGRQSSHLLGLVPTMAIPCRLGHHRHQIQSTEYGVPILGLDEQDVREMGTTQIQSVLRLDPAHKTLLRACQQPGGKLRPVFDEPFQIHEPIADRPRRNQIHVRIEGRLGGPGGTGLGPRRLLVAARQQAGHRRCGEQADRNPCSQATSPTPPTQRRRAISPVPTSSLCLPSRMSQPPRCPSRAMLISQRTRCLRPVPWSRLVHELSSVHRHGAKPPTKNHRPGHAPGLIFHQTVTRHRRRAPGPTRA